MKESKKSREQKIRSVIVNIYIFVCYYGSCAASVWKCQCWLNSSSSTMGMLNLTTMTMMMTTTTHTNIQKMSWKLKCLYFKQWARTITSFRNWAWNRQPSEICMQIHWWHCQWQLLKIWIKSFPSKESSRHSRSHTRAPYQRTDTDTLTPLTHICAHIDCFEHIWNRFWPLQTWLLYRFFALSLFSSVTRAFDTTTEWILTTQCSLMLTIITYCFHVQFGFDWHSTFFFILPSILMKWCKQLKCDNFSYAYGY